MYPASVVTPELVVRLRHCVRNTRTLIMKSFRSPMGYETKSDGSLVTSVDKALHNSLSHELGNLIPGCVVLSEEAVSHEMMAQGVQWIIDPLDGTSNFVHGVAYFCVSVALMVDGVCLYGAVYDPCADELFDALCGQGLYHNGVRVSTSALSKTGGLVSIGIAYFDQKRRENLLSALAGKYSFRYTGSMALDLAYVAMRRLRGCCFEGIQLWDGVAGALLVQEAGGLYATTHEKKSLFRDTLIDSCVAGDYDTYIVLHYAIAVRNH